MHEHWQTDPQETRRAYLFIVPLYLPNYGGIETSIRGMATAALEKGHSVTVVCSTLDQSASTPLPRREVIEGVDVQRYPHASESGSKRAEYLAAIRLLRQLRRDDRPYELILARSCWAVLLARAAGFRDVRYLVPALPHKQNTTGAPTRRRLRNGIQSTCQLGAIAAASRTFVFSKSMRRQLRKLTVGMSRPAVVTAGIDLHRFRPNPARRTATRTELGIGNDQILILGLGRLIEVKRFDLLIAAASQLPPHYRVIIAGDGPERTRIDRLIVELDARDRVMILDATSHPENLYAGADVFVLPSAYEPFGQVLVEATAAGLPIAAFACSADVETATEAIYADTPELVRFASVLSAAALAEAVIAASECNRTNADGFARDRERFLARRSWGATLQALGA